MRAFTPSVLLAAATLSYAQGLPPLRRQSTSWNSTFKFSQDQLDLGEITPEFGSMLETILDFDQTQLANGGPEHDSFYDLSQDAKCTKTPRKAGEVLKVQKVTDPEPYNIPAGTALSRIIYSSTNVNGSLVPASAYILWPFEPKSFDNRDGEGPFTKAPVVLWNHGTSGFYADGAPSAHRSLFYGDVVPFTLAQAGYAVVAPDYAGLGVSTSWNGDFVPHQYFGREAGAADALNAIRALRKVFSERLTDDYVVVGHSQGGHIAWGISEVLAMYRKQYEDVESGHLGTIAFAPGSNPFRISPSLFLPWIGKWLVDVSPGFKLTEWLTPLGVARTKFLGRVQGGQWFSTFLFQPPGAIVNPTWNESRHIKAFLQESNPGHRPFKGPMMLVQGAEDVAALLEENMALFEDTCREHPGDFEFLNIPGTGHFTSIDASRQTWLRWIEDRFRGREVKSKGCVKSELKSFLPLEEYQPVRRSFAQWSGKTEWLHQIPVSG